MAKYDLRYIQVGIVASIALFFSIVAFDNIIDYQTNFNFVQHVLSMDTTFQNPLMMRWRAITNPSLQTLAYSMIIFWQILTAIFCWAGCVMLLKNGSKQVAFGGLFFGFLLYMVGFIVIGGEWFNMWQSSRYDAQMTAGLFLSFIMFAMIFLKD